MSKKTIYTPEQLEEMKSLYQSGLAIMTVATKMNTDAGTCRKALQELSVLRTKGESQRLCMGIKFVKSDAFDILTPEALYWVGFLYADGYIEKNVMVVGLTISDVDRVHLEKFNKFLGGQLHINNIKQPVNRLLKGNLGNDSNMCRIKVTDKQLYGKLLELGFTSNKTHVIVPHELLKYSRDFWRGCVDGDGWVTISRTTGDNKKADAKVYTYPKIGLCGNEATIIAFLEFIKLNGIICASGIKKAPRENSLYSMDSTSKPAIQIMNLLYKDSTTYLDRKYEKYLECIKLNS